MTIDTTRIEMAKRMAGHTPAGAEVIGLVIESGDCYCRKWSALVRMSTGIYVTIINHTVRTLNQDIARAAIAGVA